MLVILCCKYRLFPLACGQGQLELRVARSPYVAQGAAQAVEDAAALGILLSSISTRSEIPLALKVYERSRKQRAETVQQSGSDNRITLHLPDGRQQEARDEQFRACTMGGKNPDLWADSEMQRYLWGWDAEKAALRAWDGEFDFYFTFWEQRVLIFAVVIGRKGLVLREIRHRL